MGTITHHLDYNRKSPLRLDFSNENLTIQVDENADVGFRLRQNINKALKIATETGLSKISTMPPKPINIVGDRFRLSLYGETLGEYRVDADGTISLVEGTHRPLTVSELRRLGTFYREAGAPYKQELKDAALIERAKKAVTTDFHTHSSGQISAEGLMQVAMDHDVYYPVRLLEEMGIHPSGEQKPIPRIFFAALDAGKDIPKEEPGVSLKSLTEEQRAKLALKMQMPLDRQATFTEMEYDAYRHRYPIAKPPEVQIDVLKQMAREYAEQGITHAEVAYTSLDNPTVLRNLHEAMAQMEQENAQAKASGQPAPYANLSFLFAIPRTFAPEKIADMLERTKIISQSPYVTGIDFIGYETNKTEDFSHALRPFLEWAQEHNPNLILRVHAGENAKNRSNVHDVLELANTYNIRTRIGHGIYGLEDEQTLRLAEKLAKKKQLTIEMNPDSNIALNNIDDLRALPFKMLSDRNIPFVIGSDSAGMYGTNATQLGLAGYYAGMDAKGFDALEAQQQLLVKQHQEAAAKKSGTIQNWNTPEGKMAFAESLVDSLSKIPVPVIPDNKKDYSTQRQALRDQGKLLSEDQAKGVLAGRKPIAIVGASGASWSDIKDPEQRAQIATAIDMLVHVLDPKEAYILQGRSKPTGIGKLIQKAVSNANAANSARDSTTPKLDTVSIIAKPQYDRQDAFGNIDHLIEIEGGLIDVADRIVNHVVGKNGTLVGAGGSAFTRDIILKADHRMSARSKGALMLLDCASGENNIGASGEKARMLHPHYRVQVSHGKSKETHDGREIIKNLHGLIKKNVYPNIFVEGFDPTDTEALDKLAAESRARVDSYNLDKPDSRGQTVADGETLSRGKDHDIGGK